jgi:hypothetical protein
VRAGKLEDAASAIGAAIEQLDKSSKLNDKMKKALIERSRYVLSGVLTDPGGLFVYESDGFTVAKARPQVRMTRFRSC